jgi:hypothetical protein
MTLSNLELARAERAETRLDAELDALLAAALDGVSLKAVSSPARVKLRNILKKYAKDKHPFKACVKDNMKRFGPGRTEAVCATLKDTIKGSTKWRKGGGHRVMAEEDLRIDGEVLLALDHISEVNLQEIFLEARALDEHQTVEAVALLGTNGAAELLVWGDRP